MRPKSKNKFQVGVLVKKMVYPEGLKETTKKQKSL